MVNSGSFPKYRTGGAYHWNAMRRHLRYHDCFTATRCSIVLEAVHRWHGAQILARSSVVGMGDDFLADSYTILHSTCIRIGHLGRLAAYCFSVATDQQNFSGQGPIATLVAFV
jgi:hypothetical protein